MTSAVYVCYMCGVWNTETERQRQRKTYWSESSGHQVRWKKVSKRKNKQDKKSDTGMWWNYFLSSQMVNTDVPLVNSHHLGEIWTELGNVQECVFHLLHAYRSMILSISQIGRLFLYLGYRINRLTWVNQVLMVFFNPKVHLHCYGNN